MQWLKRPLYKAQEPLVHGLEEAVCVSASDLREPHQVGGLQQVGWFVAPHRLHQRVVAVFAIPAALAAIEKHFGLPRTAIDVARDAVAMLLLEVLSLRHFLVLKRFGSLHQNVAVGGRWWRLLDVFDQQLRRFEEFRNGLLLVEVVVHEVVAGALHRLVQVTVAELAHLLVQRQMLWLFGAFVEVSSGRPVVALLVGGLALGGGGLKGRLAGGLDWRVARDKDIGTPVVGVGELVESVAVGNTRRLGSGLKPVVLLVLHAANTCVFRVLKLRQTDPLTFLYPKGRRSRRTILPEI